jgi:group II intron reverse transcriptase/maturase
MSGERSPDTVNESETTSRSEQLMEQVVAKGNMFAALRRVQQNGGAPGSDGMTAEQLPAFLKTNWLDIKAKLLDDKYKPQAVRRVEIPKPDGGLRLLGIPSVVDRLIQQALLQVLTPIFDPTFSEQSFGFRPGRSAHDAVQCAKAFIEAGNDWVVDIDLEKFFDRVNHDKLMARMWKRVEDKRVLHLIRRYLQAGVLINGVVMASDEGTPQGGPLSPLLANIMLDDLDRFLTERGHKFCRYADDCNIYVRSQRAGERVMTGTCRFLEERLSLKVNKSKSAVDRPRNRKFLGYSFFRRLGIRFRVAPKSLERFKARVREITSRSNGRSMEARINALNVYCRGWMQYFRLALTPSVFEKLENQILRRLRLCQWKNWKLPRTRLCELLALGLPEWHARQLAYSRKGYWRIAGGPLSSAMPRSYWEKRGIVRLTKLFDSFTR